MISNVEIIAYFIYVVDQRGVPVFSNPSSLKLLTQLSRRVFLLLLKVAQLTISDAFQWLNLYWTVKTKLLHDFLWLVALVLCWVHVLTLYSARRLELGIFPLLSFILNFDGLGLIGKDRKRLLSHHCRGHSLYRHHHTLSLDLRSYRTGWDELTEVRLIVCCQSFR